jgi:hypothetical protein
MDTILALPEWYKLARVGDAAYAIGSHFRSLLPFIFGRRPVYARQTAIQSPIVQIFAYDWPGFAGGHEHGHDAGRHKQFRVRHH